MLKDADVELLQVQVEITYIMHHLFLPSTKNQDFS